MSTITPWLNQTAGKPDLIGRRFAESPGLISMSNISYRIKESLPATPWLDRYDAVRNQTLKLVEPLTPEDQMVQSMPEASPAKWHLAHTTWFFEEFVLIPHLPGYGCFDGRFGFLFNSYYKQLGGHPHRTVRGTFSRPALDQVLRYRMHVDKAIHALSTRDISAEVLRLVELGLNHEQQHQELIVTDIKHAFWTNPLRPSYQTGLTHLAEIPIPQPLSWSGFDGGVHEVGHDMGRFSFDNERPRHHVHVRPFRLASRLVTNREYLEFMSDGGYERPELWLSDAWDHLCQNGWSRPLYWEKTGDAWTLFTCRGILPLDPLEPVCHVSFYEADAFARWAGARLPTEFEWEIAASYSMETALFPEKCVDNMLESETYHPAPAGGTPNHPQVSARQLFGDTWEWTSSPYSPYPGYRAPSGAEGEYNGKFMCNQMVLRGGSCVTPRSHIRKTYRNFFPPHMRWQFSGIRLAHDGAGS